MKFAVKALLMGLSVNAVKLEQKNAEKYYGYPYYSSYTNPLDYVPSADVLPAQWVDRGVAWNYNVDPVAVEEINSYPYYAGYAAPVCEECQEIVDGDCAEIHDA